MIRICNQSSQSHVFVTFVKLAIQSEHVKVDSYSITLSQLLEVKPTAFLPQTKMAALRQNQIEPQVSLSENDLNRVTKRPFSDSKSA